MTKIAVCTDAHANLSALRAALDAIRAEGCDAVYHTGDAIAMGPQPAECLDLLLSRPNAHLVMGNHDAWYVHGLPQPQPAWMSNGEVEHQHWTHAQLDASLKPIMAEWPYVVQESFDGVRVVFLHYEPADTDSGFAPVRHDAGPDELDRLFGHYGTDVVFYGHTHRAADVQGRARYVNPGALGCHREALARYVVLECAAGYYSLEHRAMPYDDRPLFDAFERRQVPERAFLYRAFFDGRFGGPG